LADIWFNSSISGKSKPFYRVGHHTWTCIKNWFSLLWFILRIRDMTFFLVWIPKTPYKF